MAQIVLSAEILSAFTIDPARGEVRWATKAPRRRLGQIAGGFDCDGYRRISLRGTGKRILASHLIWFSVHGRLPAGDIDHKNRNRADDRISNLRECSRRQNIANSGLRKTNTTGFKGVSWVPRSKKWRARIRMGAGQSPVHLGLYESAEEAGKAYRRAAVQMYGEFVQ